MTGKKVESDCSTAIHDSEMKRDSLSCSEGTCCWAWWSNCRGASVALDASRCFRGVLPLDEFKMFPKRNHVHTSLAFILTDAITLCYHFKSQQHQFPLKDPFSQSFVSHTSGGISYWVQVVQCQEIFHSWDTTWYNPKFGWCQGWNFELGAHSEATHIHKL